MPDWAQLSVFVWMNGYNLAFLAWVTGLSNESNIFLSILDLGSKTDNISGQSYHISSVGGL